jgi:hypothetical protein
MLEVGTPAFLLSLRFIVGVKSILVLLHRTEEGVIFDVSGVLLLHHQGRSVYCGLQSIRGDDTVNVNKPSPVLPQLTARSGQRAELVQVTHCIRTHVNMHADFGHPCNGTPIT